MVTAVHLGCWLCTCYNPHESNEVSFVSKTRVWTDMTVFHCSNNDGLNRVRGERQGEMCQHSTGFGILVLAAVGGSVKEKGGRGGWT